MIYLPQSIQPVRGSVGMKACMVEAFIQSERLTLRQKGKKNKKIAWELLLTSKLIFIRKHI